jgi:hypothetical protein
VFHEEDRGLQTLGCKRKEVMTEWWNAQRKEFVEDFRRQDEVYRIPTSAKKRLAVTSET